jgi:hypothetical protein
VSIIGGTGAERITFDAATFGPGHALSLSVDGRGGADSVVFDTPRNVVWTIDAMNAGRATDGVVTLDFRNVELAQGAAGNQDEFRVAATGGMTTGIDGGALGFDTLVLGAGTFKSTSYITIDSDSGIILRDANRLRFDGLEPIIDNSTTANRIIDIQPVGTTQATATLSFSTATNRYTLASDGGPLNGGPAFESIEFTRPTGNITITSSLATANVVLTIQSFDSGFTGNLLIETESITVASGATLGSATGSKIGNVTLTAAASAATATTWASLSALGTIRSVVEVAGDIYSSGTVVLTSLAQAAATATGSFNLVSGARPAVQFPELSSTARVTGTSRIEAGAFKLEARSDLDITISGSDTLLDGSAQKLFAKNTTLAELASGATVLVGTARAIGETASAVVRALDTTDLSIALDPDETRFSNVTAPAGTRPVLDDFGVSLSLLKLTRDTQAVVTGATLGQTGGGALAVEAKAGGTVTSVSNSFLIGASFVQAQDTTKATVTGSTLRGAGLSVLSGNATAYESRAKVAVNLLMGETTTRVQGSAVTVAGAVSVAARDTTSVKAISADFDVDLGLFKLEFGKANRELSLASAITSMDRDVSARVVGGTIASSGAATVEARSAQTILSEARALRTEQDGIDFGQSDSVFGGSLSWNMMMGDVTAAVEAGANLQAGGVVTIRAANDSILDSTNEATAKIGGTAGGSNVAGGINVSMNFLGYGFQDFGSDGTVTVGEIIGNILLDGIDLLLGTGANQGKLGTRDTSDVVARITGATVAAGVGAGTGALLVQAQNKVLLNSTVSNTAKSNSVGDPFFGATGKGFAMAFASNKVSTDTLAEIAATPVGGAVTADGALTVEAVDESVHHSNIKIVSSSVTTNDGGLTQIDEAIGALAPADFRTDGTTVTTGAGGSSATNPTISFGQRVALTGNWEAGNNVAVGSPGTIYQYMGGTPHGRRPHPDGLRQPRPVETRHRDRGPSRGHQPYQQRQRRRGRHGRPQHPRRLRQGAHRRRRRDRRGRPRRPRHRGGEPAGQQPDRGRKLGRQLHRRGRHLPRHRRHPVRQHRQRRGPGRDRWRLRRREHRRLRRGRGPQRGPARSLDHRAGHLGRRLDRRDAGLQHPGLPARQPPVPNRRCPDRHRDRRQDPLGRHRAHHRLRRGQPHRRDRRGRAGGRAQGLHVLRGVHLLRGGLRRRGAVRNGRAGLQHAGGIGAGLHRRHRRHRFGGKRDRLRGRRDRQGHRRRAPRKRDGAEHRAERVNNLGLGLINSFAQTLLDAYKFTSQSGTQRLNFGDKVYLGSNTGSEGAIVQWMGPNNAQVNLATGQIVGSTDATGFADLDFWKNLDATTVIDPKIAASLVKALKLKTEDANSYYVLVTRNEAEGGAAAFIDDYDVTARAVSVLATEAATLSAFDASYVEGTGQVGIGGIMVTNELNSTARAFVTDSRVTATAGGILIDARNLAVMDATALTSTSAKTQAVGVVVAFNSAGYDGSNILFQALDALLGSEYLIEQDPVGAHAYSENSVLIASGDVSALATTRQEILRLVATTAQRLDDMGDAGVDDGDIEGDAEALTALEAEFEAAGIEFEGSLSVETISSQSQWHVTDEAGRTWQVRLEGGRLVVYRANLVDARVGNEASSVAVSETVAVDAFLAADKPENKGKSITSLKYGATGMAAGGILVSNRIASETKAWIRNTVATHVAGATVQELRRGETVNVSGTIYEYVGPDRLSTIDFDYPSDYPIPTLVRGDTIKLHKEAGGFAAGTVLTYTGTTQRTDADVIALLASQPSLFARVAAPAPIVLSNAVQQFATSDLWEVRPAILGSVQAGGSVRVEAVDTANLRAVSSHRDLLGHHQQHRRLHPRRGPAHPDRIPVHHQVRHALPPDRRPRADRLGLPGRGPEQELRRQGLPLPRRPRDPEPGRGHLAGPEQPAPVAGHLG